MVFLLHNGDSLGAHFSRRSPVLVVVEKGQWFRYIGGVEAQVFRIGNEGVVRGLERRHQEKWPLFLS
mgnify:CR=1 FL=1